jgi:tetratricopeptide (TPR) repeat protein
MIGDAANPGGPIPASSFLGTNAHRRESAAVARVRAAQDAHDIDRDVHRANELWEEFFSEPPSVLDLSPISLGWAFSLLAEERFDEAISVLERHIDQAASREERILAALLKGASADGLGRRDEAAAHYTVAARLMDEVPDLTYYTIMRETAENGRRRRLEPQEVELSWWATRVPR